MFVTVWKVSVMVSVGDSCTVVFDSLLLLTAHPWPLLVWDLATSL